MTLGLFWKFPAGVFHAVKLSWNNLDTPGGKASCFPRSARDLLLRSFACSPKIIMFWRRKLLLPSPRSRKNPVCDPHTSTRGFYTCLHQPLLAQSMFYKPKSIALKEEKKGVRNCKLCGKGSALLFCVAFRPTPILFQCSTWRETRSLKRNCLAQPNLTQVLTGNSPPLPGGETGLPSSPSFTLCCKSHGSPWATLPTASAFWCPHLYSFPVPATLLSSEDAAANHPLLVLLLHTAAAKKQFFLHKEITSQ